MKFKALASLSRKIALRAYLKILDWFSLAIMILQKPHRSHTAIYSDYLPGNPVGVFAY